jgi:signal transduction histidine kinase
MAVLDSQARSATATAGTDAEVAFLASPVVWGTLERCPRFALNLVREVSLRIREFNQSYTNEVVQAERLALVGRFARSIVHDFKNPLNIIGISADMAAMETATPELRVTARNRIRRQVDRLSNMVGELLEFTRGKAGAVVLASLDYADFLRATLEEIRHEVQPRGITLVLENEPPTVRVSLDPRRLSHVFHNLINNACDALPQGGTITLRFRVDDREVVTEIQDSGKGIAPEVASRLFEAFATYGKPSGTGLGLSICRRIIEDHHGHIAARNAPGGGAVFAFTLPRPAPPGSDLKC